MIDQTRNSGRAGSAVDELFESRVAAAMRGDREAFAVLFGQRVRAVSGCVAALADSDIRADLVVVQTFVRAWRELPELPTPRQFNLWLRGIAEQEIGATRSQETDPGEAGSQPDAPAAALRRAIASLPARDRQAVLLRNVVGLSPAALGRCLEVSTAEAQAIERRALETIEEERYRLCVYGSTPSDDHAA